MKKLLFLCIILFLSGCFVLPVEDPVMPPPVAQMPEARTLRTVPVMRGDVVRDAAPVALYVPASAEQFRFSLAGYRIEGIYVDIGDYVQAGDILASLYMPDIQNRLTQRLRQLEWLELDLSQINRRISSNPGNSNHIDERNMIRRDIELIEREIDYLIRESEQRYLRTTIDGVVTSTIVFIEGMMSNATQIIATVVDHSFSVFAVRHAETHSLMNIGDTFMLSLNRVPYLAVVIDPSEFGMDRARDDEVYLIFADESPVVPARSFIIVHVVIDEVHDVLYVPRRAVHRVGERVFVYVFNEYGTRVLRDVEVGLRSNTTYEIISGLSEGELVVVG